MFISVNGQIYTAAAFNLITWRRNPPAYKYATPAMAAHYGYIGTNARGELISVAPEQAGVAS